MAAAIAGLRRVVISAPSSSTYNAFAARVANEFDAGGYATVALGGG